MGSRSRVSARRLDQVDRRSQLGVSGAARARDVSRPDDEVLAEASATDQKRAAEVARRSARSG